MCDRAISGNQRPIDNDFEINDVQVLGLEKFKSILRVEYRKKLTSRFTWGSMNEQNINLSEANLDHDDVNA